MTSPHACYSRELLLEFARGTLSLADCRCIAESVESCERCNELLAAIESGGDPFLAPLQSEGRFAPVMAAPATRSLGQYDLVAPLGTGGMGTVWQARHRSLRRAVAVKLLRVDRSVDPQIVERFFREMAAMGRLHHPHLVQAYDAGEIDGIPYLAMEFLDGVDLNELVKKTGPLTPAEACELIRQAALGLAYAHDQQCIHRDVKPSNLFVQSNGELKVLDLGLARLLNQNRAEFAETQSCQVMGTLDYMSPEQFRNASKVDARSDVYSLGCTLYFALRGTAPFREYREEGPMAMGMAHATAPIPTLSALPGAPAELVACMLAKTPNERPATMTEVATALEPYCRGGAEQLRNRLRRDHGDSVAMEADTVNRQANAQASATPHFHKPQPSSGHRWLVLVGVAAALIGGGWHFLRRPAATLSSKSASSGPASISADVPASASPPSPLVKMLTSGDYAWTDPVNLGPNVNSSDEEGSPTLSADGLCLIFSCRDQNGVRVLYESRRNSSDGPWQPPAVLDTVHGGNSQVASWLSPDGLSLLFFGVGVASYGEVDLWATRRTTRDAAWQESTNLGPVINTAELNRMARISRDGLTMFFDRTSTGRKGGIWKASRRNSDAAWEAPVLLGPPINTLDWNDDWPLPLADGRTLLFLRSSRGQVRHELCLLDLAAEGDRTVRQIDVPSDYATSGGAFWLTDDGTLYFDADRAGGNGGKDLWMCRRVRKAVLAERPAPPRAVAPFDAAEARAHQQAWADYLNTAINVTNGDGMRLTLIPPGEFLMGSSDDQIAEATHAGEEIGTNSEILSRIERFESPQRKVVITKPFWIGTTEVTVERFKKFSATGYLTDAERAATGALPSSQAAPTYLNPVYLISDDSPASVITWNDAVAYCRWLSEQEGATYRLPTDAEWEYACRAGTITQYSFGDDPSQLGKFAWHYENAGIQPRPASTKLPNGFGLFDMHGNVWEWCADYHNEKVNVTLSPFDPSGPSDGYRRVLRGGAVGYNATYCRSAFRHYGAPSNYGDSFGFRCVRTIDMSTVAQPHSSLDANFESGPAATDVFSH